MAIFIVLGSRLKSLLPTSDQTRVVLSFAVCSFQISFVPLRLVSKAPNCLLSLRSYLNLWTSVVESNLFCSSEDTIRDEST